MAIECGPQDAPFARNEVESQLFYIFGGPDSDISPSGQLLVEHSLDGGVTWVTSPLMEGDRCTPRANPLGPSGDPGSIAFIHDPVNIPPGSSVTVRWTIQDPGGDGNDGVQTVCGPIETGTDPETFCSNVTVTETTADFTTITSAGQFNVIEPCNADQAFLDWGTVAGGPYPNTEGPQAGTFNQSWELTGLTPGTEYFYRRRIEASDLGGRTLLGPECSFTTAAEVDYNIRCDGADVFPGEVTMWVLVDQADSNGPNEESVQFIWGTTQGGPYPNTSSQATTDGTDDQRIGVTAQNLDDCQVYYYVAQIVGPDPDNEILAEGPECQFESDCPTDFNPLCQPATSVTDTSGTMPGTADNVPADHDIFVVWGTTAGGPYPNTSAGVGGQNTPGQSISATDDGLTPETTYFYRVEVRDADGVVQASAECTFTTLAETEPLPPFEGCPPGEFNIVGGPEICPPGGGGGGTPPVDVEQNILCDFDADGNVVGSALAVYEYDENGDPTGPPTFVIPGTNDPYTVQGTLRPCDTPGNPGTASVFMECSDVPREAIVTGPNLIDNGDFADSEGIGASSTFGPGFSTEYVPPSPCDNIFAAACTGGSGGGHMAYFNTNAGQVTGDHIRAVPIQALSTKSLAVNVGPDVNQAIIEWQVPLVSGQEYEISADVAIINQPYGIKMTADDVDVLDLTAPDFESQWQRRNDRFVYTGPTGLVTLALKSNTGEPAGNDHTFDNFTLREVTPAQDANETEVECSDTVCAVVDHVVQTAGCNDDRRDSILANIAAAAGGGASNQVVVDEICVDGETWSRATLYETGAGSIVDTKFFGPSGQQETAPDSFTIGACGDTAFINDELLCDATGTEFLRKYVQSIDPETGVGQVVNFTDFTLGGDPFTPVPPVGVCAGQTADTEKICYTLTSTDDDVHVGWARHDDSLPPPGIAYFTSDGTPIDPTVDGFTQVVCDGPDCPRHFATECVALVEAEVTYDNTSQIAGVPGDCGSIQGPFCTGDPTLGVCFSCNGTYEITSWVIDGVELIVNPVQFTGNGCGDQPGRLHEQWAAVLTNLDTEATWEARNKEGCAWYVGASGIQAERDYGTMVVQDVNDPSQEWTLGAARFCEETPFTKVFTQECDGSVTLTYFDEDGQPVTDPPEDLQPCGACSGVRQAEGSVAEFVLCDDEGSFIRKLLQTSDGAVASVVDLTLGGEPYEVVGEVTNCTEPCCPIVLDRGCWDDGAGNTGTWVSVRNPDGSITVTDPVTGDPVDPANVVDCPSDEQCASTTSMLLCDLAGDGEPDPVVADTDPEAFDTTSGTEPVPGGAAALWGGGTLNIPPDTARPPSDNWPQFLRTFAATVQAPRPDCDTGTATVTATFTATRTGPDPGCAGTGVFRLLAGGTQVDAVGLSPNNTPVGTAAVMTVSAQVPAADLAAGNVLLFGALETYHQALGSCPGGSNPDGARIGGWDVDQFAADVVYDQAGCGEQFIRNITVDCDGNVTSINDTTLDGDPYTVQGEPGQCIAASSGGDTTVEPRADVEVVTLCDDGTPFLRHITYDAAGAVESVADTELDGITEYLPTGTVGVCDEPPAGEAGLSFTHVMNVVDGNPWMPNDIPAGQQLDSITMTVLSGLGTVVDSDGTSLVDLPAGTSLSWEAVRPFGLIGPQQIQAQGSESRVSVHFVTRST